MPFFNIPKPDDDSGPSLEKVEEKVDYWSTPMESRVLKSGYLHKYSKLVSRTEALHSCGTIKWFQLRSDRTLEELALRKWCCRGMDLLKWATENNTMIDFHTLAVNFHATPTIFFLIHSHRPVTLESASRNTQNYIIIHNVITLTQDQGLAEV